MDISFYRFGSIPCSSWLYLFVLHLATPKTSICFGDRGTLICGFNQQITAISGHFGRTGYETETTCQAPNPLDCGGDEVRNVIKIFLLITIT